MAPPSKVGANLEIHPILSRLLSNDVEACAFRGYVGPSGKEGYIRLYPSLGRLNFSIEIGLNDIIESAPAPTAVLPHNGTVVWVRNDAEVVFHGDAVTTVAVRSLRRPNSKAPMADASLAAELSEFPNRVEIGRGRLRMSLPSPTERRGECDVCASCRGCASCTSVCQSGPA